MGTLERALPWHHVSHPMHPAEEACIKSPCVVAIDYVAANQHGLHSEPPGVSRRNDELRGRLGLVRELVRSWLIWSDLHHDDMDRLDVHAVEYDGFYNANIGR